MFNSANVSDGFGGKKLTKIRTDFCQFRNYSYICITELVINPTGGSTKVAEGGLQPALYFV